MMKDLIELLREGVADTGVLIKSAANVNATMYEAADALEQQAAVIEQMREVLLSIEQHAKDSEIGCNGVVGAYELQMLLGNICSIQPCPEVLNKVRADAVLGVLDRIPAWCRAATVEAVTAAVNNYAQDIKKGEA